MLARLRRSLALKLLAAHLAIIVVGVFTLVAAATAFAPSLFESNIHALHHGLQDELVSAFRDTLVKALLIAAGAALLTALAFSALVTTRVVAPLRALGSAARRIADGSYGERVPVGDPDEIGLLAGSFNSMASALEDAEQRRRELVGDVAHELRTPLAVVDGYLEGIEDGVVEPEPQTIALLRGETRRLKRLIDDLEEVSRAETGQLRLEPAPVDPAALVAAAVEAARPEFDAKGVALERRPISGCPPVRADPDRIGQVLANLLSNALRHTPAGAGVAVGAVAAGDQVVFTVRDGGEGIDARHLPHVFERFYRADASRSRAAGGSGIGLAVVKAIVEAHGGAVQASSPGPGGGATFTFRLPADPPLP